MIETSYEKAKTSLLQKERVEVDVVWLLQDILRLEHDAKLKQFVNKQIDGLHDHPYLLMVKANAPRIELPPEPGEGIDRYFTYIQAAFGYPEDRAAHFISDFISKNETGYILTHQLASLLWAEQVELSLPPDITDRKSALLDQIYKEQIEQDYHVCVDLYAERVALLIRHGNPSQTVAESWVSKLVVSQQQNGEWPASTPVIEYDGKKATATIPPSHTTALAMLALKSYLIRY